MGNAEKVPSTSARRSGDLLFFSGRSPVSRLIRAGTCSRFSHVGMLAWITRQQVQLAQRMKLAPIAREVADTWVDRLVLFEATTLDATPCILTGQTIHGMQAANPEERIATYPGRVWVSSVNSVWQVPAATRIGFLLLEQIGRPYDAHGALLAGTRLLKHLIPWRAADRVELFCVEVAAEALKQTFSLHDLRPGKLSPKRLYRYLRKRRIYDRAKRV